MDKELIGFVFLETQEEFEAWQLENDVIVISVAPHLKNIGMVEDKQRGNENFNMNGGTEWGVFVTYRYNHAQE